MFVKLYILRNFIVSLCLQILSPNLLPIASFIYNLLRRAKFYIARANGTFIARIVELRTQKSGDAPLYRAPATACYLRLEGNGQHQSADRSVLRFSTTVTFSRSHRGCDSLAGGFRICSLRACLINMDLVGEIRGRWLGDE